MVSKAREDLPEPLSPVMTTSLSRGISSVRFFRLCSRAPPIFMKSFAIGHEFLDQAIFDTTKQRRWKQREFQNRVEKEAEATVAADVRRRIFAAVESASSRRRLHSS